MCSQIIFKILFVCDACVRVSVRVRPCAHALVRPSVHMSVLVIGTQMPMFVPVLVTMLSVNA